MCVAMGSRTAVTRMARMLSSNPVTTCSRNPLRSDTADIDSAAGTGVAGMIGVRARMPRKGVRQSADDTESRYRPQTNL